MAHAPVIEHITRITGFNVLLHDVNQIPYDVNWLVDCLPHCTGFVYDQEDPSELETHLGYLFNNLDAEPFNNTIYMSYQPTADCRHVYGVQLLVHR